MHDSSLTVQKGGIYVDMTTSQPSLAQEIDAYAKEHGMCTLDAPGCHCDWE